MENLQRFLQGLMDKMVKKSLINSFMEVLILLYQSKFKMSFKYKINNFWPV